MLAKSRAVVHRWRMTYQPHQELSRGQDDNRKAEGTDAVKHSQISRPRHLLHAVSRSSTGQPRQHSGGGWLSVPELVREIAASADRGGRQQTETRGHGCPPVMTSSRDVLGGRGQLAPYVDGTLLRPWSARRLRPVSCTRTSSPRANRAPAGRASFRRHTTAVPGQMSVAGRAFPRTPRGVGSRRHQSVS